MEVSEKRMVQIEKVQFCKDNSQQPILGCFQCPVVKRTGNLTLIQSDNVIDQICLMHDCSNGIPVHTALSQNLKHEQWLKGKQSQK
jgi:hypothetical protein